MGAIIIVAALLGGVAVAGSIFWLRSRRARPAATVRTEIWVVACPATQHQAVLEISRRGEVLDCEECSLWPDHLDCSRTCLDHLHSADREAGWPARGANHC